MADKLDNLLTRGVSNIIPSRKELEQALENKHKLNIYMGIDPTATHIHLGHAVLLRKLQEFARRGHNVTFLIGDFTALIGDSSDKDSERPVLTVEEIKNNFETYKKQASKILDFSLVRIVHNSEWLKKLDFAEIIKLCQHFSFGDFAGRELIKKRLTEGKRVGLHEALYPVMQGYDSYYLDTDLQIGGADQTFNMQAGRILQEDLRGKETFVMATNYLTGTDGRKMSKSWGNAIWLDDNAIDMYRKVMSVKDDLIIEYFTLVTRVSNEEIENYEKRLKKGENPINIKKELAEIIVSELHSKNDAKDAREAFENTVQKGELPSDISEFVVKKNMSILDVFLKSSLVESRTEAKRIIDQGGAYLNGTRLKLGDLNINAYDKIKEFELVIIRLGKHKFLKLVTS